MNTCEVQTNAWNTRKRHGREVAEHTARPNVENFIYITLAKESPIRMLDSDEDYYNSFNEQETDVCHDSSDISDTDTESQYSSVSQHSLNEPGDTITTMQVVEFEVASVTESESCLSEETSSGTDDYVLAAFAQAVADNSSVSEFALLADTEESDDQTWDSDFTPADYWKCVKCNNKQNNPMYRYCERCYQVRKSLFPPRPKQKKKLRFDVAKKDGDLSDSSSSSTSSIITKSTNIWKCL
ncbi:E3 ubiquitin-protein ligase Mdm2-like isoform X3 [Toxorhynchites rutilus septentrionalis]|uniref:E3 ubiquitin-protein ligase Mdm2-like isoform X3 n=1 Tax=Toxorhynchites rutilus septentrionalis TaxID=329112 RepID=UPI002479B15A|nr:E3 ubiquitin-protein ligase Mdm2-like isoform X3 [Toxorhynchites rutilus septentrionalis]